MAFIAPNIISSATNAPALDGAYENVVAPDQYVVDNIDSTLSGFVGGAEGGVVGVWTLFSDFASLKDGCGFNTTDPYSIARTAANFLSTGANNGGFIRVSDNTDTSAIYVITDGQTGPGIIITLTALETGQRLNVGSVQLAFGYASTTGLPTARLTIRPQYGNPEVWDGIVAYVTDSNDNSTFDMPTLIGNLAAAVSIGTAQRGPSQYFIATPGNSTASTFAAATFTVTTPGTNGTAGLTSQSLLGVDGDNRTGMWAMSGTGVKQYVLCDNADPSTVGTQAVFEAQEGCVSAVLLGFPGMTKTTAIAAKQANNVSAISQYALCEWVLVKDPVTGVPTLTPPLGHVLGAIAITPSEQSLGQVPANGFLTVLATEHSLAQPWSRSDMDALTAAGIGFISKQTYGRVPKLPHGQNASCIPGQDGLNYTRLTNELVDYTSNLLNPFVDKLQSIQQNDPLRAHITSSLNSGFGLLQSQGRIDAFKVLSDLTNNSPDTIAAGYLYVKIWVRYLAAARYIIATLQGGTTVNISTTTAPSQLVA